MVCYLYNSSFDINYKKGFLCGLIKKNNIIDAKESKLEPKEKQKE